MKRKSFLLLLLVGCAVALFLWLRRASRDYANFPPTATGPWVAFGDSLTAGLGAAAGHDYPSLLSQSLGVPILNHGRSGDTTADGLQRSEEVAQLRPRVVLLCLGGNDGLNKEPRERMLANLGVIIDRLHAEGSFVVLIGIRSASLRDRNEGHFAHLAREKRVLYVPDMLRGIAFKPVYMSDAIHPNDEGYQRIAARLERLLRSFLPQLRLSNGAGQGKS